jgi:hypothetical protein
MVVLAVVSMMAARRNRFDSFHTCETDATLV